MSVFNKKMFSDLLKKAQGDRSLNQFGLNANVDPGYISRFINLKKPNPPTPEVLRKIADTSYNGVTYEDLMEACGYIDNDAAHIKVNKNIKEPEQPPLPEEFSTPEEAIKFILEQNVIMGFGGFDIDKLSDEDKINFANELLGQLKLLSYKYKR